MIILVGRAARNYINQVCTNISCSLEDLLGAMDDRDGWRERFRKTTLKKRRYCLKVFNYKNQIYER